jgi:CheY-like chemotaxis protein
VALAEELGRRAAVAIENARLYRNIQREIVERKAAEDALREADQRKNEFLAMLGHELRNPLAAITGAAHLLAPACEGNPRLLRIREIFQQQSVHMARLLDDLLDVSRVTQGKIRISKETVDFVSVVRHAVPTAGPLIQAKEHELSVELPTQPLPLEGDPVRLAQAVANLLGNAAKFTPAQGRIWLTLAREGAEAVLRVRDSGDGIDPELLPHVFDLFVQGEQGPAREQGGLGIGLTLVKRLVELHGGSVGAHSAGSGRGSEFVMRIPLAASPAAAPDGESWPGAGRDGIPPQVLVVDDNRDAAEMVAALLESEGFAVRVAHDGPSALATAREQRPGVVLLDIGMPIMDGYEVARRLRHSEETAEVPIVALTGYGQDDARQRALQAGFLCHLTKPVDPDELFRAIRFLAGSPTER